MVAHTILLDFTVASNQILDVEKRTNLKINITNALKEHFVGLKHLTESNIDGSLFIVYTGPRGSLITVRGYVEGLVTVNVEYFQQDDEETILPFEVIQTLIKFIVCELCYKLHHQFYKSFFDDVFCKIIIHSNRFNLNQMVKKLFGGIFSENCPRSSAKLDLHDETLREI